MKTIYKYPLVVTDKQVLRLPIDAVILCVQNQFEVPCLWAIIDTETKQFEDVTIYTKGTGHSLDIERPMYIDTYQLAGGSLVFHVFI